MAAVNDLLDRLKLSNTGTVYFFDQESKWRSVVSTDTANKLIQINPTACYIFNGQPYILFFDFTASFLSMDLEAEIHKKVWSFDQSPIAFILKDNNIEIYNAFSYEKKSMKLQQIELSDGELDTIFSFWNLQSGGVWEWINEKYYKNTIKQKRVSQKLFDNIKVVRERLTLSQQLTDDEANTLILRLIFIRYLIDRNVKLPSEFIQGQFLNERRFSFSELIRKPRMLNRFFIELNNKFNGVLFRDINFELSNEQSAALAGVFSGEIAEIGSLFFGTDFFFEIFDFSIIPVELISGIYESLIDPDTRKLHSAVYTPSFLVEYMLTETVDKYLVHLSTNEVGCKIFDPSVGSGIFLVQAYRRMVEWEIKRGTEKKISKTRLRDIAVKNLFGIDINEQALKVSCFSIYIAMLDYIDPASILISFKFPDLIGNNLFKADFFDVEHPFNQKIKSENINFLLGNPPWKSDKNIHHLNWLKVNKKTVGRYEIAQSFLLRSKDFMRVGTISGLIVTSTIFYNVSTTTKIFKSEFLSTFCINSFFDLSPVRRLVFEEKDSPCSIVFYHLSNGHDHLTNVIKHLSIKANIFLKFFKALVIEKFDQKTILQKHFIENDWMFKVALYGNTLDFALLKRICSGPKISSLIDNKRIFKGAGIKSNKGKDRADFLVGLPIIENKDIKDFYTPVNEDLKVLDKEDAFFERARTKDIFFGKKILIKEQARNESELVISYVTENSVFKNGVWGICSDNDNLLKVLYSLLISDLYTYFIFITSCSWGVGTRPQIRLDEEYLSFPHVHLDKADEFKLIQLSEDFLHSFVDFYSEFRLGKPTKNENILSAINSVITRLYSIKNFEKDLIDYVLDISRYQFQENKQEKFTKKIHDNELVIEKYVDVFINAFRKNYNDEYLGIDIYALDYFIAINFVFHHDETLAKVNFVQNVTDAGDIFKILSSNLSIAKESQDLYIQKDIKGFEDNSFYIIKPNEYKCWHRAIAWYDLAEIKEAIEAAEIIHLTQDTDAS